MSDPRPLRILMICPQFRPIVGGYERAAERLSLELVRQGHAVTVVTERIDPSWPAREDLDGVEIRRLWTVFRRRLHVATAAASLGWFLLWHGRRFDVWHVHQLRDALVVASIMGRILRRPVILKLTNSGALGTAQLLAATRTPRMAARALPKVAACVAVSGDTEREAIEASVLREDIFLIPNGVDIGAFRPPSDDAERSRLRTELGVKTDHLAVFVGRLTAQKNPLGLIEAWATATTPDRWTLVMLGDGPLHGDVQALVDRLGVGSSVVLAGERDDVDQWLRAAELYVQSSDHEGLSNATLEAMASGLPVVATRVSGMNELLGSARGGRLVPPGDMPALAGELSAAMSDSQMRAQMGRAARNRIVEGYAIERTAQRHAELYRKVSRSG